MSETKTQVHKTAVLELPIDPREIKTAQQKGASVRRGRSGKAYVHHYTKSKVAKSQRALAALILSAKNRAGWVCVSRDLPVWVSVEFIYPLGSKPKKMYGAIKTTRPDGDNLLKGLLDAGTECRLWVDDAQVQISQNVKRYQYEGEEPKVILMLRV